MNKPKDTCLQCNQTRAQVKTEGTYCATVSGYEVVETRDEWDRHHWRDWSDTEFRRMGIKPRFWDEHRRTNIYGLKFVMLESYCDDHGHIATLNRQDPESCDYGAPEGMCVRCYTKFTP